jgi:Ca-activated chloride channel family protein
VQTGLLLYPAQPGQDENFFLLMVQPPRRVEPQQIPPREYIFVLDVSGSMNGFPLDTAKALMRELIGGLRPSDSFNIILFSGGSRLLAPQSLSATAANVQKAIEEIESEQGGGGTELGAALDQAMALPETKGVSRSTIVVTDGFIDAEAAVFEQIRTRLNRSNLFAFGIGTSVNRHLIEGLAHAGQGEPFIVTEPAEAKAVAKRLQDYVRSPVLTHVAVEPTDFAAYDVEPLSVPDLFADRPLVVFGKWRGKPSGTLRVTGQGGEGPYEKVFDVTEAKASAGNQALRYLWARARVARLADYGADDSDDTRKAVTALGLKYEMLTAYTSFVAVHEKVRNPDDPAQAVEQPLPMPQEVSDLAVPEPELPLLGLLVFTLLGLMAARRAWLR